MKKFLFGILSFVLMVAGGCLISADSFVQSNAVDNIFNVNSEQEFISVFTSQATYNNKDIKVIINSPLDFSNIDLSPISQNKNTFMGTLDGNGQTISNITLSSKTLYYGLIPYAKEATIKNLKIEGEVNFNFDSENIQEVFAGVLVGYGENVIIENCELDNTIVNQETKKVSYHTTDVSVYSNINFGFLAGKIKGNPNAANQTMPANIVNCVNYYNANVTLNRYTNLYLGGLVGCLENAYMLNSMNYGNITYQKSQQLSSLNSLNQYFGGISGIINGSGLNIRNTIFGGEIIPGENATGVNAVKGAIFAGSSSAQPDKININFSYFTQEDLLPCGDGYVSASEKLTRVDAINKALLQNVEYFDQSVPSWDFEKIWILSNSKFHIQNFQYFEFSFASIIDRGQVLDNDKTVFTINGSQTGSKQLKVKYGTPILIKLYIKEDLQGFYTFSNVLLNNNQFNGNYKVNEIVNDDGVIEGYTVAISANATTTGTYSFVVSQKTYSCEIAVSDAAKAGDQGGVRVQSSSNESTARYEFPMTFAVNSATTRIVAEGKDIWSFDHWEILYRDSNDEFTGNGQKLEDGEVITISFGAAPFNKEFKLVAYFTDAESIKVNFGKIDKNIIKSISLSGVEYTGEDIQVASTRRIQIEVVTQKNYLLDTVEFEQTVLQLYGNNVSPYPVIEKDAEVNEEGETTYFFTIELAKASANIKNNSLKLEFKTLEDTSNDGGNLVWLYIVLGVVGVIAIGLIIFFVVRRRNGGGRGGRVAKTKQKSKSYKDYYF